MYLIYKNFIDTYHPYGIEDIILVKSANIIHVSEQLAKNGYIGDMWLCGSDRFKSYQLMLNKYKDKCQLAESTDVFEVYRPENEISATKIREYIKVRDFEWFCHGTPFKKYASEEYAAFIYNELCRFMPSLANSSAIDLSKLQENKELNDKTLYVFDLDDTLIKTTARIRAIHSDGSLEMLTSHQYSELTDYDI